MANRKSAPERAPSPRVLDSWVRKSDLDGHLDRRLPIPTQVISNEEFLPLPQTSRQREVEHRLLALAESSRHGLARREFLRTSCGTAAAFVALNSVFGPFFRVDAAELDDPAAAPDGGSRHFILDVQTHHVNTVPAVSPGDTQFLEYLRAVRRFGGLWNPALAEREIAAEELHRLNFVKEIFLDSPTDVIVVSGLPQWTPETYPLDPEEIARTRSWINDLAGSRRVLSQGVLSPELGARNLELMQVQVEKFGVDAWKGYPGQPLGPDGSGWWLDDEKVAYPALELARKLGVRNVCLHKGLPAPGFSADHCHPRDVFKAAIDFPDLNFLVYHGGLKSVQEVLPAVESGFAESSEIPWVSDLCSWKKKHPEVKNVYMELGSTFGMTAISLPLLCGHILGMILDAFGEDHLLWGTDAIWWGSPAWQIEAFLRYEMPESLMKRFGYAALTDEIRAKVLGLNAARIYGVDPTAARRPLPDDAIDRLRAMSEQAGGSVPANTQYGWIRI